MYLSPIAAPGVVAYVEGEVPVAGVIDGRTGEIAPFRSAIDDSAAPPPGNERPDRVSGVGSGYRRDDRVRQFVLRRAKGRCEYCGILGFELPDGTNYLEAHHVIALAKEGPDKIGNVIALCAHHHREAHYGRDADKLEASFVEKLRTLTS
ncbi:HNH endonuclease [Nitrosospira briensis]|uniref:HNH endonuclease n=1 Tax=Nitrosospira briensis TaxID=35799 RepID=UPI0009F55606|nr:HNH endonuclease signature motif containing protein [Nitrosospira briensis]